MSWPLELVRSTAPKEAPTMKHWDLKPGELVELWPEPAGEMILARFRFRDTRTAAFRVEGGRLAGRLIEFLLRDDGALEERNYKAETIGRMNHHGDYNSAAARDIAVSRRPRWRIRGEGRYTRTAL